MGACVSLCVLVGVGASLAGAGGLVTTGFGLGSSVASLSESADDSSSSASGFAADESSMLAETAERDITKGIEAIEAKEEADALAAEEAARAAEEAAIATAAEKEAEQKNAAIDLSEVDFTVGRDAFIAEWTSRIDAYLAGSPLAGYGSVFATAAWENGVDPRWSPAIANTESSKGVTCFLPYNAWGWGNYSFSNWEDAINAHVAGLAKYYGYTISYSAAKKYCPPNTSMWFASTLSEMKKI